MLLSVTGRKSGLVRTTPLGYFEDGDNYVVVVMVSGGKTILGRTLMLHMGMGLLDRETGKLRYFAEGREDSLAMSVVAADGSNYLALSPLGRAWARPSTRV